MYDRSLSLSLCLANLSIHRHLSVLQVSRERDQERSLSLETDQERSLSLERLARQTDVIQMCSRDLQDRFLSLSICRTHVFERLARSTDVVHMCSRDLQDRSLSLSIYLASLSKHRDLSCKSQEHISKTDLSSCLYLSWKSLQTQRSVLHVHLQRQICREHLSRSPTVSDR